MHDAYILAGARTPIGKFQGALSQIPAPELGAIAIREALRRASVEPGSVDEVIFGNILSAGVGQAPARQAALKAGLPGTVSALTINKMCGSGLNAVMLGAQAIRAGDAEVVVAGGMESMSRSPHLLCGSREGFKLGDAKLVDSLLFDGLWCAFENCHMGALADYTAEKCHISRDDQDRFAYESQMRAGRAMREREFADEIVAVPIRLRREEVLFATDEGPRPETDLDALAKLRPAFSDKGTVTAGNASMLSDGAAAVVVATQEIADKTPAPWRAKVVAYHTSGVEPKEIFLAPVLAVRGVLEKANLKAQDIDLFELNEAFASQMLGCMKELQLDHRKVNVLGGAIALGHPIGASGARVLITLLSALKRRNLRRGLASLCLGGGNAVAMIVERDDVK